MTIRFKDMIGWLEWCVGGMLLCVVVAVMISTILLDIVIEFKKVNEVVNRGLDWLLR
jgi:hypothetical protein